jgi:uncharacterized protein
MFLPLFGLLAGFIDSIAGGGGLITLPVLTLAVGAGAMAVGTNKIVGTVGALTALLVYLRGRKLAWKKSSAFMVGIVLGSVLGSRLTPHLNRQVFNWILLGASPLILLMILNKNNLIKNVEEHALVEKNSRRKTAKIFFSGLICGIYDGGFGPGGGTFMLLALIFANGLPLFQALVLSKLANTLSAGSSWISYGLAGYVHWKEGTLVASGMLVGAYLGSSVASKRAEHIVRPMLVCVVVLFMAKIAYEIFFSQ